jgi:hypothetical protein
LLELVRVVIAAILLGDYLKLAEMVRGKRGKLFALLALQGAALHLGM